MKKVYVKDLTVGTTAQGHFSVLEKRYINYQRNGAPAAGLVMTLGDKTGRISAVAWNEALVADGTYKQDDIVEIVGRVQDYRGDRQIYLEAVRKAALSEIDPADFSGQAPRPVQEMWQELMGFIGSVKDPSLTWLLRRFFTDASYAEEADLFRKVPAGRDVHHAYIGGLLEHSLEVAEYVDHMCRVQGSMLNRDLLIAGALLHDAAKIWEYDFKSFSFEFTDRGRLLGHLVMGTELVGRLVAETPDFPTLLGQELQHMVISHHGQKEWGSAEEPKTINAVALHLADLSSSRLAQVERIVKDTLSNDERWSPWDRRFERSFMVTGRGEPREE
jgi:3'-5' exoribonuclease